VYLLYIYIYESKVVDIIIIRMMNYYWGNTKPEIDDEENCYHGNNRSQPSSRGNNMVPIPRYGHPYPLSAKGGNNDEAANDMWGACLGILICMLLLLFLVFAMSYPAQYYYYPDDPTIKDYHHSARCPSCWM
jgi:hypothetical protein